MAEISCASCDAPILVTTRHPNQRYCSKLTCQRVRKAEWQVQKRASDPDYAENQSRAQQAWATRNPGYWIAYRLAHPEYSESNRKMQMARDSHAKLTKMDASSLPIVEGDYLLHGPLDVPEGSRFTLTVKLKLLRRT